MRKLLILSAFVLFGCGTDEDQSSLSSNKGPTYLALGDSISFGFSPLIELSRDSVDAGNFVGYPEIVAQKFHYSLINVSCIGESTGSLVNSSVKDNGCHSGEDPRDQYLKIPYEGSQLDFAEKALLDNPDTALITIGIGGNDLLIAEDECDLELVPALCKVARLPKVAFDVARNIVHTMKRIRATGYDGKIIFVTNYARNYKDAVTTIALGLIQTEVKAIAVFNNFKVASGFDAFKKASEAFSGDACAAGLLIALPEGGCNQHPSLKGHKLLTETVLKALN